MMEAPYMTDWELIQQYREGTTNALGELFDRHQGQLYRLAQRMLGNADEAEDAVSEIWMRVMKHIPQYRHDAQFSTWLYRLAINYLIDTSRKRVRDSLLYINSEMRIPSSEDPDLHCEKRFQSALVHHALGQLSPAQRMLIIMRDLENMPLKEMASALDIPLSAVKSRLRRARQAFKRIASQDQRIPGQEAVGTARLTYQGFLQ